MDKYLKIAGFLVTGFGVFILLAGGDVAPAIIFIIIGLIVIFFKKTSTHFNKNNARKELMELKELLDNGVLSDEEYEEKSKVLKSKI